MRFSEGRNKDLAERLTGLLADTYVLYNTTQFYHWNVEGPQFRALHALFEEQYQDLAEAADLLAERIRILGYYTPGTLREFSEASGLEQRANVHDPERMLRDLVRGHEHVSNRLQSAIAAAEKAADEATLDLLVERVRVHEKITWMLRSQAGESSERLVEDGEVASAVVS